MVPRRMTAPPLGTVKSLPQKQQLLSLRRAQDSIGRRAPILSIAVCESAQSASQHPDNPQFKSAKSAVAVLSQIPRLEPLVPPRVVR